MKDKENKHVKLNEWDCVNDQKGSFKDVAEFLPKVPISITPSSSRVDCSVTVSHFSLSLSF